MENADLGFAAQNFLSTNAIEDVGSTANEILWTGLFLSLNLCEAINKGYGLTNPPTPDTDGNLTLVDAYPGETAACYESNSGSGFYNYYHVLVAR